MNTLLFCFLLTGFNYVMSEEPVDSQLEGSWLERISKLEVKVAIIENEIEMRDRLIKDILADQIAGMKAAMRQRVNSTVAFSSEAPDRSKYSTGDTIVFKNAVLNEGNVYDSSTGEFNAPENGLYQFSVHVCNSGGDNVAYAIVHDDALIASSVQFQHSGSSCSSVNALRVVDKGQKVYVKCTFPTVMEEDEWRSAMFMGILLHSFY
ncbi:heavy metal-binding protein HIP-like [Ruditapes philippinarum]|uniref:heavy metal-binding protein HIP-like n=1 Tax=Ruditapes philippinarum TaxID=129788 RepID=UPI00295B4501|nr:heavy metal-binding protein HIP-like [Ruditapes philippinarum]